MRMTDPIQHPHCFTSPLHPRHHRFHVVRTNSISSNTNSAHEVYDGPKTALNMYMRSYAARHAGQPRAMVLMAPGCIRTELCGPNASFGIEEAIPKVVNVFLAQRGKPGLHYPDREGHSVPW